MGTRGARLPPTCRTFAYMNLFQFKRSTEAVNAIDRVRREVCGQNAFLAGCSEVRGMFFRVQ
jgi:hypothetical protein